MKRLRGTNNKDLRHQFQTREDIGTEEEVGQVQDKQWKNGSQLSVTWLLNWARCTGSEELEVKCLQDTKTST